MNKIVADTNVIISSILTPCGKPAEIMQKFYNNKLQICYNQYILDEYKKVLKYPKLNIAKAKQKEIIKIIKEKGIIIVPNISTIMLPDESDRIFYDTAKEANAILITGNIKHFPKTDFIKTPAVYLEYIN